MGVCPFHVASSLLICKIGTIMWWRSALVLPGHFIGISTVSRTFGKATGTLGSLLSGHVAVVGACTLAGVVWICDLSLT